MIWIFYTVLSAFFFALKEIIAKKMLNRNIKPAELIFEEFMLLFLILGILFFPKINFLSYQSLWQLYLFKALSLLFSTYFYFELLKKYEISTVSPLLNLSPIFLLILSSLFLSEVISIHQFFGIFLILFSTYYLEVIVHHHDKENRHKHHFEIMKEFKSLFFIFTIFTLVTVSFTAIFDKMILEKVNVYTNLFFTSFIISFVLLLNYLKNKNLFETINNIKKEPDMFIIAIFSSISNFLILLAMAIPAAMVSLIIPLRRTSTLFSSLIGGILFHEKHLMQKMVSIMIMLVGVVLIVI